jgi:hypothetical protein
VKPSVSQKWLRATLAGIKGFGNSNTVVQQAEKSAAANADSRPNRTHTAEILSPVRRIVRHGVSWSAREKSRLHDPAELYTMTRGIAAVMRGRHGEPFVQLRVRRVIGKLTHFSFLIFAVMRNDWVQ